MYLSMSMFSHGRFSLLKRERAAQKKGEKKERNIKCVVLLVVLVLDIYLSLSLHVIVRQQYLKTEPSH